MVYDAIYFEFRTNNVSNWVKVVTKEGTNVIHDIAVLKSMKEE